MQQNMMRSMSTRFKSLINKSLFILIVHSWPLADEVMWERESTVPNQNKSTLAESETNTELSKSRWCMPIFLDLGENLDHFTSLITQDNLM